jgi:DNA helicase IV
VTPQSERAVEQAEVDRLYQRLDRVRATMRRRLVRVRKEGPSGSPQNRSERDAFATMYEDRLASLNAVEERLVFGRLDLSDGNIRYIGRIGLADEHHASILTDWRAPAAQAFYQATAVRPDGVVRRRHLLTKGRTVTGIEDEILDLDAVEPGGSHEHLAATTLAGDGALIAALGAKRTGRMGDIVATIQAEQDAIIRSDLAGTLVVEGGPGTGKTVVALHRVAYLLYAHRAILERAGVLVLGPSRVFLRYIDQVLPALGETGVVATTIADLVPGVEVVAADSPEATVLKGKESMARVIARAVYNRTRIPAEIRTFRFGSRDLELRPTDFAAAAARARATHKPYNQARVTFVREMLDLLALQFLNSVTEDASDADRADVAEDLRHHRDVRIALNLAWMPMTPQKLVGELYTKPVLLAAAAPRMRAEDRAVLYRADADAWTEADVPLLDEAATLLGVDDRAQQAIAARAAAQHEADVEYARHVLGVQDNQYVSPELLASRFAERGPYLTSAERAVVDREWTYAHIVVDEAQELSPMAWRMVARRCPTKSLTVVGDLAQRSNPAGVRSWSDALSPVFGSSWRQASLSVNYRNPAAVADAAVRYAKAAGLPLTPTTNAREVPDSLVVTQADDLTSSVVDAVHVAATTIGVSWDEGRIAVVAAPERLDELTAALALGPDGELLPTIERRILDAPIVVLSATATKGLEFDAVILVEPVEITSPADLFVAMTRPTAQLHIVHCAPLPAGLAKG